jgi:hypothetical protein
MRQFTFRANVWLYPGTSAAWHFISLPKKEAEQVKKFQEGKERRGWGAVGVRATILRPGSGQVGKTTWETSMFPDKKSGTYILPLKASVRKKEGIVAKDIISIELTML